MLLNVAAAALNQTPLDWAGNKANIITALTRARAAQVDVLCLPELCITGYGCEDAFFSPDVHATALAVLNELLPETEGIVACMGLPMQHGNGIFNTVALIANGQVLGISAKKFLAGDGVHYEPRWFKPWPVGVHSSVTIGAHTVPFGDLYYEIDGVRLGFEICEDAWAADRPGTQLSQRGVDLILNPSASHFAFGKHDIRRRFCLEGSRAFGCAYLYANLLGCEAGRIVYDGDCLITSQGALLASGPRFAFHDVALTGASIDLTAQRFRRAQLSSLSPMPRDEPQRVVAQGCLRTQRHRIPPPTPSPWEGSATLKEEEFTRAVALGLFDYLRKSRSKGFVVSLSGGADSSAVSCLVAVMVRLAGEDLTWQGVATKLSYEPSLPPLLQGPDPARRVTEQLLTCVYQRSRNNSDITRDAAKTLAETLGATFYEIDIDRFVDGYVEVVQQLLGRALTWERDDLALQNVQARARVPSVWLLANVKGALLLTTSNRSEAAVGYATMDGDTAGGLNPIGGIDKAFLRRWLRWLEREGPLGIGPIPALHAVNAQQPTAELRPLERSQTDEADLMPYEVLDAIERLAIRDKLSPLQVFERLSSQYEKDALVGWITRFFTLWATNQWKRERYAPAFHLDDENLDPKTWCRFPILSGGYQRELAALHAAHRTTEQL